MRAGRRKRGSLPGTRGSLPGTRGALRACASCVAIAAMVAGCFVDYGPSFTPTPSLGGTSQSSSATAPTAAVASLEPSTSPEAGSGVIVFQSSRDKTKPLWRVLPDGTGLRALAIEQQAGSPALSADGAAIAFTWNNLFVAAADGSNVRAFAAEAGRTDDAAAWAPDGHRILYVNGGAGAFDKAFSILDIDTKKVTGLGAQPSGDRPAWSPDGRSIVYGNADNGGIAAYDVERKVVTRLTAGSEDGFASYSPDGRLIAFERGDVETPDGTNHHIYVAFADGGNPLPLTSGPSDDEYPAWSPDGAWIVFARLDGKGGGALWRVAVTGGDPVRITLDGSLDTWPAWGPCSTLC